MQGTVNFNGINVSGLGGQDDDDPDAAGPDPRGLRDDDGCSARRCRERLPDVIGRVGAIVEQPKFFPSFSGRKNLTMLARAIDAPTTLVDVVLSDVGLLDRADDRYKGYSLGMKQRLAIAATLLKDPDLLIFDEPTNGLDPAGIREIRGTMRGLADRGKTVLVSSHILAEVEQVADTVSIIARGELIAERHASRTSSGRARPARCGWASPTCRARSRCSARRAGPCGPRGGTCWSTAGWPRRASPRRSRRSGCSSTSWCPSASTSSPSSSSSPPAEDRGRTRRHPPGEHRPAHHAEEAS